MDLVNMKNQTFGKIMGNMKIALVRIDPMLGKRYHSAGAAIYNLKAQIYKDNLLKRRIHVETFEFDSQFTGDATINAVRIFEYRPDIAGFSCYCWNMGIVLHYTKLLKQLLPNVKIVLGGPEVSFNSEEILKKNDEIDVIVRGEGEATFHELVSSLLRNGGKMEEVLGISYRVGAKIVTTKDRPLISDLDQIPSPLLEGLIDLQKSNGEVMLETIRGCPYHCSYCLHNKAMPIMRSYSMQRIEKELKYLCRSKHVRLIWFVDPSFNANEERALKILQIIEENNKNVSLAFEIKAELLTHRVIDQFSRLNILEIGIGLQSINKNTNKNINRSFDMEKFESNLKKLQVAISNTCTRFDVDLIYGLPGDTIHDYKKAIDYVLSLGAQVYYQPLRVFSGTQIRKDCPKFSIVFDPETPNNVQANATFSVADMKRAYLINAGLDLYQKSPKIKEVMGIFAQALNCSLSDLFERLGKFLWDRNMTCHFRIANWTPDDRPIEGCFKDFLAFASTIYEHHREILPSENQISQILRSKGKHTHPAGYFRFAI
jgi:radical SAM superfamily enzyme YgiQ (UPF0313 family)